MKPQYSGSLIASREAINAEYWHDSFQELEMSWKAPFVSPLNPPPTTLNTMASASQAAIRFVLNTTKSKKVPSSSASTGTYYLRCHVKPGASKDREGVAGLTNDLIELCVSARAREGEANKAVVKVLSDILQVPKSELQITQGLKSRDKTVALNTRVAGAPEHFVGTLRERLEKSMDDT
ncbi:hypothetical protein MKZ38_008834 [Zalerion maritima]|uniref:Uncharacterized protein n=1 Tax=Zalerion maritima TaxID=339359 RepID=A0AAD5WV08_9PEZI|nr:hypothetical protein MKZ38_008834 [Zalerion maritima]